MKWPKPIEYGVPKPKLIWGPGARDRALEKQNEQETQNILLHLLVKLRFTCMFWGFLFIGSPILGRELRQAHSIQPSHCCHSGDACEVIGPCRPSLCASAWRGGGSPACAGQKLIFVSPSIYKYKHQILQCIL